MNAIDAAARQQNTTEEGEAVRAAHRASAAAGFLAVLKLALFWKTGSLLVALSALDSTMDVLISFVNGRVLRYARRTPDDDHRYGHGKAESIASFAQGGLIAGAGIAILGSSVQPIYEGVRGTSHSVQSDWYTVLFFLGCAAMSALIAWRLRRRGNQLNSPALHGDSAHYMSDVITNSGSAAAVAAVLLSGVVWLDPLLAGLFAVWILIGGIRLMRSNIDELMDKEVEEEFALKVQNLVLERNPEIEDIHKFRGRRSGHRFFFDFHVSLPTAMSFAEVHAVVDRIEHLLDLEFDADVVVHADPDSLRDDAAAPALRPKRL